MTAQRKHWIKNFDALGGSDGRKVALALVNAALNAIDTEQVIGSSVELCRNELRIAERTFALEHVRRIYVFGVGKAASEAAVVLERILGDRIAGGVVIGHSPVGGGRIKMFRGDHPLPSAANMEASAEMAALAGQLSKEDLALVVVSGGGSAHLCWPASEVEQGRRLYQDFVQAGGTIVELNTVRKHLSTLKGGGLAKMLFPATVVGLIFSDVPGDQYPMVASGPTYLDETTAREARRILEKYILSGYELIETPKEERYFDQVSNRVLVSNQVALGAMRDCARGIGLKAMVYSDAVYDPVASAAEKIFAAARGSDACDVILAGGEPEVKVPKQHGRGGRNQLLALLALSHLSDGQVFVSFGSDGLDNGPAAGAIADGITAEKARTLGLDPGDYFMRYDSASLFEKTGDQIITGPTGANVSDLMVLVRPLGGVNKLSQGSA